MSWALCLPPLRPMWSWAVLTVPSWESGKPGDLLLEALGALAGTSPQLGTIIAPAVQSTPPASIRHWRTSYLSSLCLHYLICKFGRIPITSQGCYED